MDLKALLYNDSLHLPLLHLLLPDDMAAIVKNPDLKFYGHRHLHLLLPHPHGPQGPPLQLPLSPLPPLVASSTELVLPKALSAMM